MSSQQDNRSIRNLITRRQLTTDATPPWAGIAFRHSVGSDELSDQLKLAYPGYMNLRQRKHMAAIDFLQEELRKMQEEDAAPIGLAEPEDNQQPASPPSDSDHSNGGSMNGSRQHSPSCSKSPSPSTSSRGVDSNEQPTTTLRRQASFPPPQTMNSAGGALGQHFVFSAVDGRAMQPKTKRKMTLQERSAYKETRRRGACTKCRRQKGKCTHINDDVTSPKQPQSSTKRRNLTDADPGRRDATKSFKSDQISDVHNTDRRASTESSQPYHTPDYNPAQKRRPPPPMSHVAPDNRASGHVGSAEAVSSNGQWRIKSGINDQTELLSPSSTSNSDSPSSSVATTPSATNTSVTTPADAVPT